MKYIIVIVFLLSFLHHPLKANTTDTDNTNTKDKITVSGTALNAKLGAVVKTETSVYYIDGLNEWPDEFHNKKITVTGILKSQHYDKKDLKTEDGLTKTGMSGEKLTIYNASWELVK